MAPLFLEPAVAVELIGMLGARLTAPTDFGLLIANAGCAL